MDHDTCHVMFKSQMDPTDVSRSKSAAEMQDASKSWIFLIDEIQIQDP